MNTDNLVTMIVGGVSYTLSLEDIDPHVDSYFTCVLKDTWNANPSAPVIIAGDGVIFKFIYIYLCTSQFEFHTRNKPTLPQLVSIRREADYFNLAGLVKICDDKILSYLTSWCVRDLPKRNLCANYECVLESTTENDLANILAKQLHNGTFTGLVNYDLQEIAQEDLLPLDFDITTLVVDSHFDANLQCYKYRDDDFTDITSSIPSVCNNDCYLVYDYNVGIIYTKQSSHAVIWEDRYRQDKVATVYAIRQAAQEGGRIVVTRNGAQKNISKAGEYIVCMSGSTVEIEPIVSGYLMLTKGCMYLKYQLPRKTYYDLCTKQIPLEPTIPAELALATIRAVHQELQSRPGCSSVVVCLSSYYPVRDLDLDLESPHSEVDAALLTGLDQAYYELLAEHFEVMLVTVYVQFVSDRMRTGADIKTGTSAGRNYCRGCVCSPAPEVSDPVRSDDPVKMRIFSPPYGYGHPLNTVQTGGDRGSLFTGIVLSERA